MTDFKSPVTATGAFPIGDHSSPLPSSEDNVHIVEYDVGYSGQPGEQNTLPSIDKGLNEDVRGHTRNEILHAEDNQKCTSVLGVKLELPNDHLPSVNVNYLEPPISPHLRQRHRSGSSTDTFGDADSAEDNSVCGDVTGYMEVDTWLDDCFSGDASEAGITRSRRARILSDVECLPSNIPKQPRNKPVDAEIKDRETKVVSNACQEEDINSHIGSCFTDQSKDESQWLIGEFRPRVSSWPLQPPVIRREDAPSPLSKVNQESH